jgi:hypothetical protein
MAYQEQRHCSQYSDTAVGVQLPVGSIVWTSPYRPAQLCGPPSLLSSCLRVRIIFPTQKAQIAVGRATSYWPNNRGSITRRVNSLNVPISSSPALRPTQSPVLMSPCLTWFPMKPSIATQLQRSTLTFYWIDVQQEAARKGKNYKRNSVSELYSLHKKPRLLVERRATDQMTGVRLPVGSIVWTSPYRPARLCGPPSLLSSCLRVWIIFPTQKAQTAVSRATSYWPNNRGSITSRVNSLDVPISSSPALRPTQSPILISPCLNYIPYTKSPDSCW